MTSDSTDQEMLYEVGDRMIECSECRKTVLAEATYFYPEYEPNA